MMRRATAAEERMIVAAMAAHGVSVREVWVLPGEAVGAWAPVRGRMRIREGFFAAPPRRQRAILAHEAGHVIGRHWLRCVVLASVLEGVLVAARFLLAPAILSAWWTIPLGGVGVAVSEVFVWVIVAAVGRRQEHLADRWAIEHGGISLETYAEHLAGVEHLKGMGWVDRLLASHPTPERRMRVLWGAMGGGKQ